MSGEQGDYLPFDKTLHPGHRVDLIISANLMKDLADVRSAMILDITDTDVIVSQTDPPLLRSKVGSDIEVTVTHRDQATADVTRWGWVGTIQEFLPEYRLSQGEGEQPRTVQALSISPPRGGALTRMNARMNYRIVHGYDKDITLQTRPSFGRASLLDFSAGGCRVAVPEQAPAPAGLKLWFALFFPPTVPGEEPVSVTGQAEVVRRTYDEHDLPRFRAKVGLKFTDMDITSSRALQRMINYYMLEEQRTHYRDAL